MINRFGDPFEALLAIQRALDARISSDWMGSRTSGTGSFPPINIFQQGDDFVAIVELPGMDKNNLEIEAKENTIRISGRKTIQYDEGASIHRRERIWGTFDRTISVPIQIDPDAVKADYQEGVLALFIPRAESDKPRTIAIR
ncbi:Hsp20/alpha crystallin family protein [Inquilinus sp. OTU3971]|uniref:Hsp20/alpha crystallin family protein n=1 Tax=Inquilinus sp. OTU3971 TaxID=3043855 RepID=UPI00313BEF63